MLGPEHRDLDAYESKLKAAKYPNKAALKLLYGI